MARMVLCTGNPGKIAELRALMPPDMELLSLADVGLPADLPETGATLEANALQKARFAHERTGLPCIADDTGLEVLALGGAPGVRSARYAGEAKDPAACRARAERWFGHLRMAEEYVRFYRGWLAGGALPAGERTR